MLVPVRVVAGRTIHRIGFKITFAFDEPWVLVGSMDAATCGWLSLEMLKIINRISGPKVKRRSQVDALSAAMALTANVVHSFAWQVVRMRDEFCAVGIRVLAVEFYMRLCWSVTSFAGDAQND